MFKLCRLTYRNLGRNRRRSLLTLAAVALGLALLIVTSGLSQGGLQSALENNIRLETGHVQVCAVSYDADKLSLVEKDLLDDPRGLVTRARSLAGVRVATPVLWASGVLGARAESVTVRVTGIDPLSEAHAPFRQSLVAGEFLAPDDRSGILIGQRMAKSIGLDVGGRASLMVSTADERPDEGIFTVRGLFATGIPYYDDTLVLMPLDKAQAFTRVKERASAILILTRRREEAAAVTAALQAPRLSVLTWRDLNKLMLQSSKMATGFLNLMNLVTLAVVAVGIANTLLMAVLERTREVGVLAAMGMKRRHILAMFLMEAGGLALFGIVLGVLLGGLAVGYFATAGLDIGDATNTATSGVFAYGTTLYARFSPPDVAALSLTGLVIALLASLYPAWLAARVEPAQALHAI